MVNMMTMKYTKDFSAETERLKNEIQAADSIVIGAGAGLSTAAGPLTSGDSAGAGLWAA